MISVRRDGVFIDLTELAEAYPDGNAADFDRDWTYLGRIIRRLALRRAEQREAMVTEIRRPRASA
jgi:hypothetical protein